MIELRRPSVSLLFAMLLLVLTACTACDTASDELVGVWQTKALGVSVGIDDSYAAIYITDDGNLFALDTKPTSVGHMTDIYHFKYDFTNGKLVTTPVGENWSGLDLEKVRITINDNKIQLDKWEAKDWASWISPEDVSYTLGKATDEVPYGWTDVDRQEIQATNEQIHEVTVAFVQRFSDALGLPVLHYDKKFTWGMPTIPYIIEEIPIEIGFIGEPPSPRKPQMYDQSQSFTRNTILQVQRHKHSQIQLLSGFIEWDEVRSTTGQFALYHHWNYDIPEEWLVIFGNLDDTIKWSMQ